MSGSGEPPRATLIRWLKLNLALISFCAASAIGLAGVLIGWGIQVGHYDSRVSALETFKTEHKLVDDTNAAAFRAINTRLSEMADLRYADLNAAADARRQDHDAAAELRRQDHDATRDIKSEVDMLNQRTGWTADNLPRRK
jgi:hypothetical protein